MTLKIRYESESFPANAPIVNGVETLTTTWDDILWAAITVGRPNRLANANFAGALYH